MPGDEQTALPGFGTVKFALKVQNANIEVSAELPEGQVRPGVLLPMVQGMANLLADLTARSAESMGRKVSCREGCSACCYHPVPITPVEARMLAEWIEGQSEDRRAELRERFQRTAAKLEDAGIARSVRDLSGRVVAGALHEMGLKYFALGVPCPFLENDRCCAYEVRPLRCREYMVVSPAENCREPELKETVSVLPPVLLSQILNQWDTSGDEQPEELILLAMLDEWVQRHPVEEDRAHRTSPELLKEFLHKFAKDAAEAPDTPRLKGGAAAAQ